MAEWVARKPSTGLSVAAGGLLGWLVVAAGFPLRGDARDAPASPQGPVAEDGLQMTVQVDKTSVELGERLTLTISIVGAAGSERLESLELPEGFRVVAEHRATNVSVRLGAVERSLNMRYVLVAERPGTFQLGPFALVRDGKHLSSDPVEIMVRKSVLPPGAQKRRRYSL